MHVKQTFAGLVGNTQTLRERIVPRRQVAPSDAYFGPDS